MDVGIGFGFYNDIGPATRPENQSVVRNLETINKSVLITLKHL